MPSRASRADRPALHQESFELELRPPRGAYRAARPRPPGTAAVATQRALRPRTPCCPVREPLHRVHCPVLVLTLMRTGPTNPSGVTRNTAARSAARPPPSPPPPTYWGATALRRSLTLGSSFGPCSINCCTVHRCSSLSIVSLKVHGWNRRMVAPWMRNASPVNGQSAVA